MSTYIQRTDYLPRIKDKRLTQLVEGDNNLLDTAEATAIQIVKDALHSRYNIDIIFAKTGTARDAQVVEWVCSLVAYFLYRRIPDKLIPENVVTDYDNTIEMLEKLEDGKRSTQLERLKDSDDKPLTKFRYGSETKRTH